MITKVEVLFYKGLKYTNAYLSNYNILVGPNASGKSSLIDIFNLLKDILNDGPTAAVEKRCSQFKELIWNQKREYFEIAIEFRLPKNNNSDFTFARYELLLTQNETKGIVIENEGLWLFRNILNGIPKKEKKQLDLFPTEQEEPQHIIRQSQRTPIGWKKIVSKSEKGNDFFRSETSKWNIIYRFGPQKASLARIPEDEKKFPHALWVKNILMEGIQFIQLNSVSMRWPCRPDAPISFNADGSNLPKVVKALIENHAENYLRWVEHVKTALTDVRTIGVKERPEDRFLYIYIEYQNNITIPSWLLSDGTLRLLAQTLIAYLPYQDRLFIIEEPENGLHPQAIETVVQSLSSVYDNQVILATHSPVVLRLAEPKDILCFAKTESGAVDIVRGSDHPRLKDWKKDVDLATLHAAGVLQ